jgi:hypothetical protein
VVATRERLRATQASVSNTKITKPSQDHKEILGELRFLRGLRVE